MSLFISFPISSIQHGLKFSRFLALLTNFQRNFVVLKLDIWTICACANWNSFSTTRNLLTTFDLGKSASFISSISWDGISWHLAPGFFFGRWIYLMTFSDLKMTKRSQGQGFPPFIMIYFQRFVYKKTAVLIIYTRNPILSFRK